MHWDYEHPVRKSLTAFLAECEPDAIEAYVAYEQAYFESADEESSGDSGEPTDENDYEDFL